MLKLKKAIRKEKKMTFKELEILNNGIYEILNNKSKVRRKKELKSVIRILKKEVKNYKGGK